MIGFPSVTRPPLWPLELAALALAIGVAVGSVIGWRAHRPPPPTTCPAQTEHMVTIEKEGPIRWRDRDVFRDRERVVTRYQDREGRPVEVVRYVNRDVEKEKLIVKDGATKTADAVKVVAPQALTVPPTWTLGAAAGLSLTGERAFRADMARRLWGPVSVTVGADTTGRAWAGLQVGWR